MRPVKSLTATVHVKFNYGEDDSATKEVEMMGKILNQASEMPPELQELLVKFADHLNQLSHYGQSVS